MESKVVPQEQRLGSTMANKRLGFRSIPDYCYTAVVVLVILGAAEVSAQQRWVSHLVLPAPSDVFGALRAGFISGRYWAAILATLGATFAGFAIASAIAILVGGILGSVKRLEDVFMPLVFALQATPKIALAPLVILWLGFGAESKIVVVGIICFFPVLVNTLAGMRIRDRDQVELLRVLGASKYQLLRYIRLPNAVPYIFAGLHVGIIFALLGAVVAELIGSDAGLGYLLIQEQALFNVPGVFAIIMILMFVGIILNRIVVAVESRVAFWAQDTSKVEI